MASTPLPSATEAQVRAIGTADLVVGIPSYNNAATIGHVARAAGAGLAKYFPGAKAVIVNSDGGSTDGTPQAVLEVELPDLRTVLVDHAAGETAREMQDAGPADVKARMERLALVFEELKPLLEEWPVREKETAS